MNTAELIQSLVNDWEYTKADATKAVKDVFDAVQNGIMEEGEVRVHGFGTFVKTERAARAGRNPATGEAIQIPASTSVKLKVATQLKNAVA